MKVDVAVFLVDMKGEGIPHLWSGDIGVPTIYWYVRGGFQSEYTGVRSTEAMMRFIKQWVNLEHSYLCFDGRLKHPFPSSVTHVFVGLYPCMLYVQTVANIIVKNVGIT